MKTISNEQEFMLLDGEQLCELANMGYVLREVNVPVTSGDEPAVIKITLMAVGRMDRVLLLPRRQGMADVLYACMGSDPVVLLTKLLPLLKA